MASLTYQKGSWTPTLDGAVSGTTTYTTQTGYYVKIGKMVWVYGQIIITGATGTGNARFTLPYAGTADFVGAVALSSAAWAWPGIDTMVTFRINAGSSIGNITGQKSNTGAAFLQMTNGAANFRFSLVYETNA